MSTDNFALCTKKESIEASCITCPDCRFVYDLIKAVHCCNDPPCGLDGVTVYNE